MKESTHNLKLIARGACLGYAIAIIIFMIFSIPDFTLLYFSFNAAFWGMGVGIITELCFPRKSLKEKLLFYITGISLSPVALLILFESLPYFEEAIFFILFSAIIAIPLVLCFKRVTKAEFFTYIIGYISVFAAFAFSFFLSLSFQTLIRGTTATLIAAISSFTFATTSVLFTKKFPQKTTKTKDIL